MTNTQTILYVIGVTTPAVVLWVALFWKR